MKSNPRKLSSLILSAIVAISLGNASAEHRDNTMTNTYEIKSWDEEPYLELENSAKYSNAKLQKNYSGEFEGEGQLQYLMAYNESGAAYFTGIEHFKGQINGVKGYLSFAHKGSFKNGSVDSSFHIIEGSQSESFTKLLGEGNFSTGHSMTVEFEFSFTTKD